MGFDVKRYLTERKALVEESLYDYLPSSDRSGTRLEEAMNYSVRAGGKRLRPALVIAAGEAVGGDIEALMPVACAVEMIHTYSLIHDDLPAMDDDALRRGVPTNHSVFGEATAILAGDALLTDAFSIISEVGLAKGLSALQVARIIACVAKAAGSRGMVGGQALDLELEGKEASLAEIERVHMSKTAALIEASIVSGGIAGGANDAQVESLRRYARALGLAFQIMDDVLDIVGGEETGKERGGDAKNRKATYPSVVGVKKAREKASILTAEAIKSLDGFDHRADPIREIARFLGERKY